MSRGEAGTGDAKAAAAGARPGPGLAVWSGRALSGLVGILLLADAAAKLAALPMVLDANASLGFAGAGAARSLGVLLLCCTLAYLFPPTAVLGAILLTGYLGGAVAVQARVGAPLFSHVLFGVYLATALWLGLYLRDARVRLLFPFGGNGGSERAAG